jgi:hypothetical protein
MERPLRKNLLKNPRQIYLSQLQVLGNYNYVKIYLVTLVLGPRPVESKILGRFLPKARPVAAPAAKNATVSGAGAASGGAEKVQTGARVAELMASALKI